MSDLKHDLRGDLVRRREEEKEQRREAIVDAAERVFTESGFDAAKMEDVARHARVSRALVYLYFKNKAELHLAICARALTVLRERFVDALDERASGYEQVLTLGRSYFAFAEELPCYFQALTRLEAHPPEQVAPDSIEQTVMDCGLAVHMVTVACIERGMRDGSIRADLEHPLLSALSLWAFTHGLIQLAHTKHHFFSRIGIGTERFVDYAIDLAARGLRPVPERAR